MFPNKRKGRNPTSRPHLTPESHFRYLPFRSSPFVANRPAVGFPKHISILLFSVPPCCQYSKPFLIYTITKSLAMFLSLGSSLLSPNIQLMRSQKELQRQIDLPLQASMEALPLTAIMTSDKLLICSSSSFNYLLSFLFPRFLEGFLNSLAELKNTLCQHVRHILRECVLLPSSWQFLRTLYILFYPPNWSPVEPLPHLVWWKHSWLLTGTASVASLAQFILFCLGHSFQLS